MNNDKKYNKRAFTIKEAADYACVGRTTVENWLKKGLLPYEELPGRGEGLYHYRRVRKKDLDDFINKFYLKYYRPHSDNKKVSKELILLPRIS